MPQNSTYPTDLHRVAAETIVEVYCRHPAVIAVLLVNSCARGQGTPASDLDLAVLTVPHITAVQQSTLESSWRELYAGSDALRRLRASGPFAGVHLDFFNGSYRPNTWDDGGGPDGFELAIGNQMVYSLVLWQHGTAVDQLRAKWLPFYPEALRRQRFAMVRDACFYDLDHIPFYIGRGLYFQAFDRLYKALQEFLQALFIARRIYPVAYNKWIREQIAGWLELPGLYRELTSLLQIGRLESDELIGKGDHLRKLMQQWAAF
jgi:predicted nucleotidyltransferase